MDDLELLKLKKRRHLFLAILFLILPIVVLSNSGITLGTLVTSVASLGFVSINCNLYKKDKIEIRKLLKQEIKILVEQEKIKEQENIKQQEKIKNNDIFYEKQCEKQKIKSIGQKKRVGR